MRKVGAGFGASPDFCVSLVCVGDDGYLGICDEAAGDCDDGAGEAGGVAERPAEEAVAGVGEALSRDVSDDREDEVVGEGDAHSHHDWLGDGGDGVVDDEEHLVFLSVCIPF